MLRPVLRPLPAALLGVVATLVVSLGVVPGAAAEVPVTAPPRVLGTPAYGEVLTADPGEWAASDPTFEVRWLRDGRPVTGAVASTYRPRIADIGHDLSVEVTAVATGDTGTAVSEEVRVRPGTLLVRKAPRADGVARPDRMLTADPGSWSRPPDRVRFQWLRDGRPIRGATRARHRLATADVGHRVAVRVTAVRAGYRTASAISAARGVQHRVPVRRTVTYSVATRGRIVADRAAFRTLAQQTLDDPRGWRASGIRFKRVASGGGFTLVLAEASQLPSFSSQCSVEWSCRVGRFVVINQTRWQQATPMWRSRKQSLRGYRHMVVNHELGHWLGHGHRGCPRPGALAPVMQTQSKGLAGCRPNPWPTASERRVPRFR